jgi:hypothetical protein
MRVGWFGGEPVRRHPVVMAAGAAHRDMSNGTVGAGQGEALGDLGGRAAAGAGRDAHADAARICPRAPGAEAALLTARRLKVITSGPVLCQECHA